MFVRSKVLPGWFLLAVIQCTCTPTFAQNLSWRSEGTFDASTVPQSAVNEFVDTTIGGIAITDVDFAHSITVLAECCN